MSTVTTHIFPKDEGWAVRKEGEGRASLLVVKDGAKWAVKELNAERASAVLPTQAEAIDRARKLAGGKSIQVVYSTQKQAIDAARKIVHNAKAGQIVVHGRDGSVHLGEVHGLPTVQTSRRKSDLGTEAIKRAVSMVIRERLEGK